MFVFCCLIRLKFVVLFVIVLYLLVSDIFLVVLVMMGRNFIFRGLWVLLVKNFVIELLLLVIICLVFFMFMCLMVFISSVLVLGIVVLVVWFIVVFSVFICFCWLVVWSNWVVLLRKFGKGM